MVVSISLSEHYSVRKHSEKLKVVCPEKENLAKLIDEIDLDSVLLSTR